MIQQMEGIVIRSFDYGEGNKIITLYTKENGKVGIMARGARKARSRFTAAAQLFTDGHYTFYRKSGLGTLNDAQIIHSHSTLRQDLYLAAYSSYLAELVDRLIGEEELASAFLFAQLRACLLALGEGKEPLIVLSLFELKILELIGYTPVLDRCVHCNDGWNEAFASVNLGGVLCEKCKHKDSDAKVMSPQVVKLLIILQKLDARRLGDIQVKEATKQSIKSFMQAFMERHVEVQLKSRRFLDQLDKYDF